MTPIRAPFGDKATILLYRLENGHYRVKSEDLIAAIQEDIGVDVETAILMKGEMLAEFVEIGKLTGLHVRLFDDEVN